MSHSCRSADWNHFVEPIYADGMAVRLYCYTEKNAPRNADANTRWTFRRRKVPFASTPDTGLARHECRHRRNRCKLQHLPDASKRTSEETMISNPFPTLPWQVVASDLFNFDGREYVLIVDYYSNDPEVEHLSNTRSATVIIKIIRMLVRHGKCQKLVSDNGPQYSSSEFSKFADKWDFHNGTSSPTYHQSNGLAERTVQTIKRLIRKAKEEKKDPYLSLL